MAEDNLSLEETNKIRLSLGLKPIPVPTGPTVPKVPTDSEDHNNGKSPQNSNDSTQNHMGSKDELNIEETNKIRISLGLKPISEITQTENSAEETEEINWKQYENQQRAAAETSRVRRNIEKAKERARLRQLSAGKSIAEEHKQGDNGDDSTTWLDQLGKKAEKKSGKRKPREVKPVISYTEDDLTGMRVEHKISDIVAGGDDVILTLKDTDVLKDGDDEEDVLISENIRVKPRHQRSEISGKAENPEIGFKIGDAIPEDDAMFGDLAGEEMETIGRIGNDSGNHKQSKTKISLTTEHPLAQFDDFQEAIDRQMAETARNDYKEEKSKKFKARKVKKDGKNSKSKRRKLESTEIVGNPQEIAVKSVDNDGDFPMGPVELVDEDSGVYNDDEELQRLLAVERRRKLREKAKEKAEEKAEEKTENHNSGDFGRDEEILARKQGNIQQIVELEENVAIGGTQEFLSTLTVKQEQPEAENAENAGIKTERNGNTEIPVELAVKTEPESRGSGIPENSIDSNPNIKQEHSSDVEAALEEEPEVQQGLGVTLNLLKARGLVEEADEQRKQFYKKQREWERMKDLQRLRDSLNSGAEDSRKSEADRKEKEIAKELVAHAKEKFKDYVPEVHVEYRDDRGNVLGTKEAFKHLSHQFHGKGPGNKKTEKMLKKEKEKKKQMAKSGFL